MDVTLITHTAFGLCLLFYDLWPLACGCNGRTSDLRLLVACSMPSRSTFTCVGQLSPATPASLNRVLASARVISEGGGVASAG